MLFINWAGIDLKDEQTKEYLVYAFATAQVRSRPHGAYGQWLLLPPNPTCHQQRPLTPRAFPQTTRNDPTALCLAHTSV
jgi:hypothetical protein